jgi:hypothetical protein
MWDPYSVFTCRGEVNNALTAMKTVLEALGGQEQLILAREPGLSWRQREGFKSNATRLALLQDARIELGRVGHYLADLSSLTRKDLGRAVELYRFLREELVRADLAVYRNRPRLAVKADLLVRNRTGAIENVSRARVVLEERLPEGVYFYADVIPFSNLETANGKRPAHQVFADLVQELKKVVGDAGGFLEELEGTDNVRGFLPNVRYAYRFLTKGIRDLTRQFARNHGCNKEVGWSIGVACGEARVLFGRLQAGSTPGGGTAWDAVVEAAKLMEEADGCSRADYALRSSLGLAGTSVSQHLTFFSKTFVDSLREAGEDTGDLREVPSKVPAKEGYWCWSEVATPPRARSGES